MSDERLIPKLPEWPPAWNPFEVFLLGLSLVSSFGLLRGNPGSMVLDEQLNDLVVSLWGVALAAGSVTALAGVFCYRWQDTLMPGLVLERAGLLLVGTAAVVYSGVVLSAVSLDSARWPVSIQIAFAGACFFRSWQDHRAIGRSYRIVSRELDADGR